MEKLFDAYYTRDKENNMEMGLTIYQRIIKVHGGRIIVDNSPEDGVIFSFSLPIKSLS